MSAIDALAKHVGSRRYARDLIECGGTLRTRPWWDGVLNTWDSQQQDLLHDARVAHGYPPRGLAAALIAKSRAIRMTAAQEEERRRSFVYGNVSLSNPLVTRAMVDEAADRMAKESKPDA